MKCWWIALISLSRVSPMSDKERIKLKTKVKRMFTSSFNSYMSNAFPEDELDPINCRGKSRDNNIHNWGINDVLGNFSLTLVDSLDTLPLLGDRTGFEKAVATVIQTVSFDKDSRVQVFEVTIRALGALLSAHLLASDKNHGFKISWYDDQLLGLAKDLGYFFSLNEIGIDYCRLSKRAQGCPIQELI
jgi:mannosidase alpha-like ER degradation enhancer 1